MPIELHFATDATLDAFVSRAAAHFFAGSERKTRTHIGRFDERETSFVLALEDAAPVATVTIRWRANYPPFREAGVPLIQNVEIRHDLRGQGYGSRVLDAVERHIARTSSKAGICVGLFDAYGPAQRLYARLGYLPDGRGACRRFTPLQRGETITLDDDHLIWLVKDLRDDP